MDFPFYEPTFDLFSLSCLFYLKLGFGFVFFFGSTLSVVSFFFVIFFFFHVYVLFLEFTNLFSCDFMVLVHL